jgi:hypothetical protein
MPDRTYEKSGWASNEAVEGQVLAGEDGSKVRGLLKEINFSVDPQANSEYRYSCNRP